MSRCPFFSQCDEKLKKGAVLFLVLKDKKFVHASWVFLGTKAAPFDGIFKNMNDERTGFIGPCYTDPKYRGKGIYTYVLAMICDFLKGCGKERVLINGRITNIASLRGIAKAGFKPFLEFICIRLLSLSFYKTRRAKGPVIQDEIKI